MNPEEFTKAAEEVKHLTEQLLLPFGFEVEMTFDARRATATLRFSLTVRQRHSVLFGNLFQWIRQLNAASPEMYDADYRQQIPEQLALEMLRSCIAMFQGGEEDMPRVRSDTAYMGQSRHPAFTESAHALARVVLAGNPEAARLLADEVFEHTKGNS